MPHNILIQELVNSELPHKVISLKTKNVHWCIGAVLLFLTGVVSKTSHLT